MKLHHAIFLRFCLKEGKRALNITKFGMHSYLPNGHLNIWSYFNSKKLVKREALSCAFAKVAHKGSEIARNVTKVSMCAYLLKWVPKSTFKFHFWKTQQKCIFSTFVWPSLNEDPSENAWWRLHLFPISQPFSPPLSQTLTKSNDGVSLWQFSQSWNLIIDLDARLI